jgi:CNT family concentrative nucleoside transporter
VLVGLAWLLSEDRRGARPGLVAAGLAIQLGLALVMLHWGAVQRGLAFLNDAVLALQDATLAGSRFVFGYLAGGELPFEATGPGSSFILAFQALPLVLVVSALSSLLFHWGILPRVVGALSWLLQRGLRVGGALGLAAAANIFVGMVEAPLLVRPYLRAMSRAELFAVMTTGMATVAGTVMVLYASVLGPVLPGAMGHILTASLISAPAAIVVAHLMVPGSLATTGSLPPRKQGGAMDALTRGTLDGLRLLAGIAAMLLVFVALVSLVNQGLGLLPGVAGAELTLQRILGWVLAPLAWLLGIPWEDAPAAGALLGTKVVLNEFLAYLELVEAEGLGERSRLILVYALCGFANFGSLGIMLGGLTALVPERRAELSALGLRSIASGFLATCMTGAMVGLVTAPISL